MGAIIALTISKPVEIRMFKTEIDVKLYDEQQKLEKDFERNTNANFEDRIKLVDNDLAKVENERNQLLILLTETTKKYNEAASKRVTRWTKSYTDDNGVFHPSYSYEVIDPSASLFQAQMDRLTKQIEDFDQKNASKLKKIEEYRERIRNEKGTTLSQNKKISAGLDGLLERIKLAHEIAGFWISLFITLLFMAIELTPVFFKLMLVKTPYDYLAENRDDLIKAEYGIEVKYDFYLDKEGQERHLVINHEAERLIYEKIKVTEIQKELTDYAIEQYKKKEMKRIEDNLDDYIKSIDSDEQGS